MNQVVVLQPNGRNQVVKVTPNTFVLEIINDVCKKLGLPPEEYDLKHYRNILDVTATVRFCGLPQHAKLELIPAKHPRTESEITICLQLETGERLEGKFEPSAALWDIINKMAPKLVESYNNPLLVYMQRKICGQHDLMATSLKKIGLTGGRAAFRLLNQSLNVPLSKASAPGENELTRIERSNDLAPEPNAAIVNITTNSKQDMSNTSIKTSIIEASASNLSEGEKFINQDISATTAYNPVDKGSSDEMCINVITGQESEFNSAVSKEERSGNIGVKRPRVLTPENSEPVQLERVYLLGDRSAVAYNLDSIAPTEMEDLPDDFYELTISDVRSLAASARHAVMELENAPMLTAQQRRLDRDGLILQKLSQYKSCVIRIRFPDRSVLQGFFKPIETIGDVHEFVNQYLSCPLNFSLYTSPPKKVLKKPERLIEADCVPSAILYLSVDNEPSTGKYLKQDVISQFSSYNAANETANGLRMNYSANNSKTIDEKGSAPARTSQSNNDSTIRSTNSSISNSKGTGVPKWLKLSK